MNKTKKLWLSTSLVALLAPSVLVSAQGPAVAAQPKSVAQANRVQSTQRQTSYQVKSGDTLSTIANKLKMDLRVLAYLNKTGQVNIIKPGAVIEAHFDSNQRAERMTISAPEQEAVEVDIPVNLTPLHKVKAATFVQRTTPVAPAVYTEETTQEVVTVDEIETTVEEVEEATEATPAVEQSTPEVEVTQEEPQQSRSNSLHLTSPKVQAQPSTTQEEKPANVVTPPVVNAEETTKEVVESTLETTEETTEETTQVVAPKPEKEVDEGVYTQPPVEAEPVEETTTQVEVSIEEPIVEETEEVVPETPAETPSVDGLQPHAAAYKDLVGSMFGITNFSTFRPGDPGDHGKGLAVDFMVYSNEQLGDAVAEYTLEQMKSGQSRISYVIWKQRIAGPWTGYQWQDMEDRGNITANHFDHVHVSFNP